MSVAFDPNRLVAVLHRHQVRCVLIGGLAASLHGSPAFTNDADICPDRRPDNLQRLVKALRSLKARMRTESEPDGLAFDCSIELLGQVDLLNLTTTAGDLDIAFTPAGTAGYDDLVTRAEHFEFDGVEVVVADLDDIIRSKRAADRPKDRAALPMLLALRDEIGRRH